MKISGFSFARNADKLGYPVAESIRSILPICEEFIIVIGKGDEDDHTRTLVTAIKSPKIIIVDSEWTDIDKLRSRIYSQQTNIALKHCSGDWCFYIQCDEVVHEKYLPYIRGQCEAYLKNKRVEGFLFNYKHFWGDYNHYLINHKWYPREVRIVRNKIGAQSIGDAQSFKKGNKKLRVIQLNAEIFHYGWVRNPTLMRRRNNSVAITYQGREKAAKTAYNTSNFEYGSLERCFYYKDSYPRVMEKRIKEMNWKEELQYTGKSKVSFNHDRLKYRILTFIEQKLFQGSGKEPWGYKNFKVIKN